jgi:beta-glucosidase
MPGPTRWRGDILAHAINSRKVADHVLDERVRNVLKLVNYAGKSGIPERAEEKVLNTEEDRALLRRAAAQSVVLLKNENGILPLDKNKPITVIGPNSKFPAYCGGGSASLLPYYTVTPFDAVSEVSTAGVTFSQGVYAHQDLPLLGPLMKNPDGKQGFRFIVYNDPPGHKDRTPIDTLDLIYSTGFLPDYVNPKIKSPEFYVDMVGTYTPEEDGIYDFGVIVSGTAQLFIDGELVVDNTRNQTAGSSFFGAGTIEERGSKELKAGTPHQVVFQFGSYKTSKLNTNGNAVSGYGGFKFGGCRRIDHEESIAQAVAAAKKTDQVVLFAGLNGEWESEGYDRANMDLPPGSDELIARVVEANPNTVVVIQSGTPVTMPWANKTNALLQAWFGGNETGHGISDVLFGNVNPSGKLPLTFPVRLQDNPSYVNFGSVRGRVLYGEDVYVGYRYYEKVQLAPQFAFGHGLSYTIFSRSNLKVTVDDGNITASLQVKNEGLLTGAEVVQLWVLPSTGSSIARPVRELKGFKKAELKAGEEKAVEIVVPKKVATSFWDEIRDSWASEKGEYLVRITGTGDSQLEASFQIDKTVYWKGL